QTLSAGQTAVFTSKTDSDFPYEVIWQVSSDGPSGPFRSIVGNPSAFSDQLVLENVGPGLNGRAYRAVFSNASGSRPSKPASLQVVNWAATVTTSDHVPFEGAGITASGPISLQLGHPPVPGKNL